MFSEEHDAVVAASRKKIQLLRSNFLGYFISSMLAGIYIGISVILVYTIGAQLSAAQSPWAKAAMGASFGVGLSLVIMAGAELFTGNVLAVSAGLFKKMISWADAIWMMLVCYVGNMAGSILLALVYAQTGLNTGIVGDFIANSSATKMALPWGQLFFRGLLCNMLVCLAIWCSFRCKEEVAKLIMVFWCLFAFITSGFEHSVANMTLLAIGLANPGSAAVSIGGYAYNLAVVTLGNIVGGVLFVALPYYVIARSRRN